MKPLTNKPIALMLLFVLLIFFVTCSPSREEIAEKVKRSMQQKFDDGYQKGVLMVKSVTVLKKNENQYQGIAEVIYKASTYDVAVEIIADKEDVIWKTEPGAFMFISQNEISNILSANSKKYPLINNSVADYAKILSIKEKSNLEIKVRSFEKNKSVRIVVFIVDSLNGESIDDYSLIVAKNWIHDNHYNGKLILFLISMTDKKVRIEVSDDVKLDDKVVKNIIETDILPLFRVGRYCDGIEQGIESLSKRL